MHSATSGLALPTLARMPRSYTRPSYSPLAASTALVLMDLGILPAGTRARTEADALRAGLARWLEQRAGPLRMINFALHFADSGRRDLFERDPSDNDGHPAGDPDQRPPQIELAVIPPREGWEVVLIGERMDALQQAHPGLGETAMYWIDAAASKTLQLYTPANALQFAMWAWWGGCEDETEYFAELVTQGEKPEDIDIPTRAQFDAEIPRYASAPRAKLSALRLARIGDGRTQGRHAARATLELREAITRHAGHALREESRYDALHGDDRFNVSIACALYWRTRGHPNMMSRALDDFGEELQNSGEYREHFFAEAIDAADLAEALPRWLNELDHTLAILRALEALLTLVGEPNSTNTKRRH